MKQRVDCTFCQIPSASILLEHGGFHVIFDEYPVNPGHLLIISKRHVPDLFSLTQSEFSELYTVLQQARETLGTESKPDGYNVGANCGEAAGQTIFHFHLHVIPRYLGDVESPRGGVRNIKEPVRAY